MKKNFLQYSGLILLGLVSVSVILTDNPAGSALILFFLLSVSFFCGRFSRFLKRLAAFLPIIFVLSASAAFSLPGKVIASFPLGLNITDGGLLQAAMISLKFSSLIGIAVIISYFPSQMLVSAFLSAASPLRRYRFLSSVLSATALSIYLCSRFLDKPGLKKRLRGISISRPFSGLAELTGGLIDEMRTAAGSRDIKT